MYIGTLGTSNIKVYKAITFTSILSATVQYSPTVGTIKRKRVNSALYQLGTGQLGPILKMGKRHQRTPIVTGYCRRQFT
jgi:hypothetical protein